MQHPNHHAGPPTVAVGTLERCAIVLGLASLTVWLVVTPVAALVLSAVVGGIAVLAMFAAVGAVAMIEAVLVVDRLRKGWSVPGDSASTIGV